MTFLHKLIIGNRFLRYTPFWWWWRYMAHEGYRFDDIQLSKSFWSCLNSGCEDMNYKWAFETFWGKGSKPERIVLPAEDFDALVDRLNEPPDPAIMERFREILNRKTPFEND
jgi:hypothetical protein